MNSRIVVSALTCGISLAAGAQAAAGLTVNQIVEKNASARGGAEAWKKIDTMVWVGHVESSTAAGRLPFILEMKFPNKTRFEIKAQGQTAVRVFDGSHGWKLHVAGSGRPEVQPYTSEELNFERDGKGMGMPFMNFDVAAGTLMLEGEDQVDGRRAYRIGVRTASGSSHLWVDAETFLVTKSTRDFRNAMGQEGAASVRYLDYRVVQGLQMPFTIESGGTGKPADKMVIDRVVLNPPLDDRLFARPPVPVRRNMVSIDTGAPHVKSMPSRVPGRSAPAGRGGQ